MIDTTDIDLHTLNVSYKPLKPIERLERVFASFDHEEILVTSSFGTTSGILMGMVSKVAPGHPIHFIDTTFCFKKTLGYKEALTRLLKLNIVNVLPDLEDNLKARSEEMWANQPDQCCHVNKIKPFEPYKKGKKIWISGLLMNQTPFRENLEIFEPRNGILKMHPNIDTTAEGFERFLIENFIPPHPLKIDGYESVGCTHCTVKGSGRSGRWQGKSKTECGLHT
jgi:3''-phosphoadenosine 5''-phosphosulfate sulfotransferase (PAPS reductase)/FAD synthetase and related enzymes